MIESFKKRLLIDMDGVMADIYPALFKHEELQSGQKKTMADVVGKLEGEGFPNISKYIYEPHFFFLLEPMEKSIEVVKKLNENYELYIVSAATEFPYSLTEKMLWLKKHFSFIHWKQVVLCGTKHIVKGDIMIDDHFKNLDYFEGKTLLFNQPHNLLCAEGRHQRVNDWNEIEQILLP